MVILLRGWRRLMLWMVSRLEIAYMSFWWTTSD
jgi:hypothetical protein